MKNSYNPAHAFDPGPPTFLNRLTCLFRTHMWATTRIDHYLYTISVICLRCSRTMTTSLRFGSIVSEPEEPIVTQE